MSGDVSVGISLFADALIQGAAGRRGRLRQNSFQSKPAEAPRSLCNSCTRFEITGAASATTAILSAVVYSVRFSSRALPANTVNATSGSKHAMAMRIRSEERRVGKEGRAEGWRG